MDKRKRDSNNSQSSYALVSQRAKRVNAGGSSNAVASSTEQNNQRIIRRTGPTASYPSSTPITKDQWNDIVGRQIPLDSQTVAYHSSGWKEFVDSMASNISEGRSDMYDGHRELFVVCSRVYRCSPISLFSPLYGLSCDAPHPDRSLMNDTQSPWSQTSVRQLTEIATHPIFRGNTGHLAVIFQYAVILRTDDRRAWVMAIQSPIQGGLFAQLQRRITDDKGEDGMLAHPVGRLQRETYFENRLGESSGLWDLMSTLELIIKYPATCNPGTLYHLGVPIYHVTATDIKNVQLAINNSNCEGIFRFTSTSQCYKRFMQRLGEPEGGPDFDQLADFYCRAWHFEERRVAGTIG